MEDEDKKRRMRIKRRMTKMRKTSSQSRMKTAKRRRTTTTRRKMAAVRSKRRRCVPKSPTFSFYCRSLIFIQQANGNSEPSNKPKTSKKGKATEEEDPTSVVIEMNQHVSLTFSLKYLVNFSKSASLSNKVWQLMMSNDVPLLVSPSPFFMLTRLT